MSATTRRPVGPGHVNPLEVPFLELAIAAAEEGPTPEAFALLGESFERYAAILRVWREQPEPGSHEAVVLGELVIHLQQAVRCCASLADHGADAQEKPLGSRQTAEGHRAGAPAKKPYTPPTLRHLGSASNLAANELDEPGEE